MTTTGTPPGADWKEPGVFRSPGATARLERHWASPSTPCSPLPRVGTMTETTANPMFYPAERGPGHGVWSHVKGGGYGDASDRRYQARSLALITSNGVLVQEQIIRQNIQMGNNRNVFQTTSASIEFYKPDGSLLAKGCATAQGTRF